MAGKDYDPLVAPIPTEVPLHDAPLVRVISQVRFPIIVSIEKQEFIGPFQEALRKNYPVLRVEQTHGVIVGTQGVEATQAQTTWRFNDVDGKWRASLAPGFVALETTGYTSRSDFLDRFKFILDAVTVQIGPKVVDRLGIRYIDQIMGDKVRKIDTLVRQEILGALATPLSKYIHHSLCESRLKAPVEKADMLVRWGQLPPKMTPDPSAIEPISDLSWILDIDMFSTETCNFDPDGLTGRARSYAERIYTIFRWMVTDAFLRQYGGTI